VLASRAMRVQNDPPGLAVRNSHRRPHALGVALLALGVLLALVGCGGGAAGPTLVPVADATPTPTPDPHLHAPVSVDTVFTWLTRHGVTIIPNNADAGGPGELVKRINATYAGWPLILSQYSSEAAARDASGIGRKVTKPTADEAPFSFLGLNVVVDFGPRLLRDDDPAPDARFVTAATTLALALDSILGPLGVRVVSPVALPTPVPTATPSPAPTVAPTPAPSPTPTASG
jgi:hypothetical protein